MIDRTLNYGRPLIEAYLKSINSADTIVDIGAGTGVDLDIAKKVHPQAQIRGIEVYPPAVSKLRQRNYEISSINIEKDPFPYENESVDVVMANQVLEHVKEIFWILHEMSRVLKVGGHIILGLPNLASLHNRILLAMGRQPTSITVSSAHVRGYTRSGLNQFLRDVCPHLYEVKRYKGANFYPFPPVVARPLASLFPGMAVCSFFLLQKKQPYHQEILDFAAPGKLETNYYIGPNGH